ncbi:MAG: hypothetical protein QW336_00650 [Candidatus Anstonellales archaeon]
MGSDLKRLIEPIAQTVHISKLSNRIITIDGNNMIYQFLAAIRTSDGEYLRDQKGEITSHLSGAFYRLSNFLINRIKLIVVFDGKPPYFKRAEIEKRILARSKTQYRDMVFTDTMKEETIELLNAMGIITIIAPSEGEAQASYLTRVGTAYAINSQDYDSFLFGAKRILRNYYGENRFEFVELDSVLKHLNIDHEQLILLGMLIGTDFNTGIDGIGPIRGLEMVRKMSKSEILDMISKDNGVDAMEIFEFFLNPPVKDVKLDFPSFDPDRLREILVTRHGFSAQRVENVINSIQKVRKERTVFDL